MYTTYTSIYIKYYFQITSMNNMDNTEKFPSVYVHTHTHTHTHTYTYRMSGDSILRSYSQGCSQSHISYEHGTIINGYRDMGI